MPFSTFNGESFFGIAVQMNRTRAKRDRQVLSAPGQDGQGSLDLGARGQTVLVKGRIFAPTAEEFNAIELLIESYDDGEAYEFYDNKGNYWPACLLMDYKPESPVQTDPNLGYTTRYELTILILRNP